LAWTFFAPVLDSIRIVPPKISSGGIMRVSAKWLVLAAALCATPVLADDAPASGSDTPTESSFRRQGALLDRSPQRRPMMVSLFLGLPYGYYYYGFPFGLGGRFLIPLVHDGFIPSVNDSFSMSSERISRAPPATASTACSAFPSK
jgi:hypothetical protein